jgi:hypothetical protein
VRICACADASVRSTCSAQSTRFVEVDDGLKIDDIQHSLQWQPTAQDTLIKS